ncbi:MAG TPA: hypothetical protein VGF55_26910 [Gemmataceae bacterium]|jgi:hypothetical protein
MNAAPDLPPPPECAAALDVLHRRLDGETVDLPPAVAAHVAACPDCRGRFAAIDRLTAALTGTQLPPVRPLLTERIVAGALADGRRRQRLRRLPLAVAGLAAAALAAIWLSRLPSTLSPVTPRPAGPEMVREQQPATPNLRREAAEAGQAVASLTRRTAADAVGVGRQLVPAVPTPPWPPALEPAARPFGDAGQALADGFEPVATSARRAARLFWRDLPLAQQD